MFAKFIVFEGPDKVGKATQSKRLEVFLGAQGKDVKRVEVPFHDFFTYHTLYWMLRKGHAVTYPNMFQTIQFVNKFAYQVVVLPWHWLLCDYVVFDRWSLSSIIYGAAGGANQSWVKFLARFLVRARHTVILMGPAFKSDRKDDSYEAHTKLQEDVRVGYMSAAAQLPNVTLVVNTPGAEREETHKRIVRTLLQKGAL
jgi:thymidylate kinase